MQVNTIRGFLNGILSSASFGLIPLFTIPLMSAGMKSPTILFYRFLFASVALAGLLLVSRQSFHLKPKDIKSLMLLAFLYCASSVLLFWGYTFMASGVATTIHFMYPVFTTMIMMIFFKEKKSFSRILAVLLAVAGVCFLSGISGNGSYSLAGTIIVVLSAVAYGTYLVAVNHLNIEMTGFKLTFYVFAISSFYMLVFILATGNFMPVKSWDMIGNLLLLAFIPTIISNLALVQSLKHIGSTLTSVLGAMEPVTAVVVGIIAFNEKLTVYTSVGILLIIAAVLIIILNKALGK